MALIAAPALAVAGLSIAAASSAAVPHGHAASASTERYKPAQYTVRPNKNGNALDCNGWSSTSKLVAPHMRELCVDPHGIAGKVMGKNCGYAPTTPRSSVVGRFVDNCHYVGHDEPSVKFISSTPGSGYQMTYYMKLPKDPKAPPNSAGTVTHYSELTGAAWFGLPLCDPASYGQNPCTPHSDANASQFDNPSVAGSAFMELQFYAPGFTPFQDNNSCSVTRWCAAMTIDSLASQFDFANINLNCPEPVNFAYLQTNGVPAGPPSPQLTDGSTYTPNSDTLEMKSGDLVKVAITDPLTGLNAGFTATVTDLTTHQTGFMIASATNGFMNTDFTNCNGTPFTFHAEYNTAKKQNQVPWAELEGGVLMEQEIGHAEVCGSLKNTDPTTAQGLTDPMTADTCVGGPEGAHATGEGGCSGETGVCQGAKTEGRNGPRACPANNFTSVTLCEYADGTCVPKGSRSVTLNGVPVTEHMPVNFCEANRFQNGDLDFDGLSYTKGHWPNGTSKTPTSFRYAGPFLQSGKPYAQVQFETDAPGSEFLCNTSNGARCDIPPLGAAFYPFWTMTNKAGQGIGHLFPRNACIWNFGSIIAGVTTKNLGKDKQYGHYHVARPFGTNISRVLANPEISGGCPVLHQPR